ncbi:MAG: hypothetical protein WAO75_02765 [Atribacterales bacterium]
MKKPEPVSEKGKIKEAKDPADWYMVHELLSPPLSFRLHPYLQEINRYYFKARDRFIIK